MSTGWDDPRWDFVEDVRQAAHAEGRPVLIKFDTATAHVMNEDGTFDPPLPQ